MEGSQVKNIPYQRFNTLSIIVYFLVANAEKIEANTVRNTNLYKLCKYLQRFILFHIFHILTAKQREYRAKENTVQVPLPSKGHVQFQWFELADESSEY